MKTINCVRENAEYEGDVTVTGDVRPSVTLTVKNGKLQFMVQLRQELN